VIIFINSVFLAVTVYLLAKVYWRDIRNKFMLSQNIMTKYEGKIWHKNYQRKLHKRQLAIARWKQIRIFLHNQTNELRLLYGTSQKKIEEIINNHL
jgi:hypothetical protein